MNSLKNQMKKQRSPSGAGADLKGEENEDLIEGKQIEKRNGSQEYDGLNLTVVQTEDLNQVPRETYTARTGVLSSENILTQAFYRSPNPLTMMKDKQQTYFGELG